MTGANFGEEDMTTPSARRNRLAGIAAVTLACGLATGALVAYQSADQLLTEESEKFHALMETRRMALLEYLVSVREEARFWARNRIMRRVPPRRSA